MDLSDQQTAILRHLARLRRHAIQAYKAREECETEEQFRRESAPLFKIQEFGVRWTVAGDPEARASANRALRKLEEEGFVRLRRRPQGVGQALQNGEETAHDMATRVKLTEKGKRAASRLNTEARARV